LLTRTAASSLQAIPHGIFSLFFPAECRICDTPLQGFTRVPVCHACLNTPQPLEADFFCVLCKAPFQNSFALDAKGVCALCRSGLRGFDRASSFGFYDGARVTVELPLGVAARPAVPTTLAAEIS